VCAKRPGVPYRYRKIGKLVWSFSRRKTEEKALTIGVYFLSLPGKAHAKCLERRCREIIGQELADTQCGFRPGLSTTDQIFTFQQIFEKSWGMPNTSRPTHGLSTSRGLRPGSWGNHRGVLREYSVVGCLLISFMLWYCCSDLSVRVAGVNSK